MRVVYARAARSASVVAVVEAPVAVAAEQAELRMPMVPGPAAQPRFAPLTPE
jgi:hypothetical protein